MIELPHKSAIAAFDVDVQRTFTPLCPQELPVEGADQLAQPLNAQAELAQYRVGSKDAHSLKAKWIADESHPQLSPVDGENMDVRWVPHAIVGTSGFDLIPGMPAVTHYDFFVWKGIELDMHPYGACYHDFAEKLSTGVIEFLKFRHVELVLVGGLVTDHCVKATALQLRRASFDVLVNLSACVGISPETTDAAINEMKSQGIEIVADLSQLSP